MWDTQAGSFLTWAFHYIAKTLAWSTRSVTIWSEGLPLTLDDQFEYPPSLRELQKMFSWQHQYIFPIWVKFIGIPESRLRFMFHSLNLEYLFGIWCFTWLWWRLLSKFSMFWFFKQIEFEFCSPKFRTVSPLCFRFPILCKNLISFFSPLFSSQSALIYFRCFFVSLTHIPPEHFSQWCN